MADSPEVVDIHIESIASEKESISIDSHDRIAITLSSRIERVEPLPSRFEELSDDASVHELEAVYATHTGPLSHLRHLDNVVLCEANDPTALTTLEVLQRTFSMYHGRKPRPQISVTIPRSKSLHTTPTKSTSTAPNRPSSPSLAAENRRSFSQLPSLPRSLVSSSLSSRTSGRPYSSISVPLFMKASEIAQVMEQESIYQARNQGGSEALPSRSCSRPTSKYQDCREAPTEPYAETIYEQNDTSCFSNPTSSSSSLASHETQTDHDATANHSGIAPLVRSDETGHSGERGDAGDGSDDDSDNNGESSEGTEDKGIALTGQKPTTALLNKPLPPEPEPRFSAILPPLAPRPKLMRMSRSQDSLPRRKHSPDGRDRTSGIKRRATATSPSLDQALQELEWRLSSIRHQLLGTDPPSPSAWKEGVFATKLARTMPASEPGASNDFSSLFIPSLRRAPLIRSVSMIHPPPPSSPTYEKRRTRSFGSSPPNSNRVSNRDAVSRKDVAETWYRTASERSSVDLSQSVFSEHSIYGATGTPGIERSRVQETQKNNKQVPGARIDRVCGKTEATSAEAEQTLQPFEVAQDVGERIVLGIMSNLPALSDLFNFALVNKGFYYIFKQNEFRLIRAVMRNSSEAMWELRETANEHPTTVQQYLQMHRVEMYVMGMLKSLILMRCESFLRPSTIAGLVGTDEEEAAAIDAAFWRVWTFCCQFGHQAGQDSDIEAQIDWLNGGPLAREKDPETSFGKGNGRGLSKEEVYDMIEVSNCLSVLMQVYHGRVDQAETAGVYDKCDDSEGLDRQHKEMLLEEWTWYIMTQGPSYVYAMTAGSFETGASLGLTQWDPPDWCNGKSRSQFLNKPLTRVYEARLAAESGRTGNKAQRSSKASSHRLTKSELAREIGRARQLAFAEEIKFQRQPKSPGTIEPLTFADERPMSVYSQIVKAMNQGPCRVSAQDLATMPKLNTQVRASTAGSTAADKTSTPPQPEAPPVSVSACAVPSADDDFPVEVMVEDTRCPSPRCPSLRAPSPGEHSPRGPSPLTPADEAVLLGESPLTDPTDYALAHLVNVLGFGVEQAKWALTRSENGHGINMEQAIALLVQNDGSPKSQVSSRASSRQDNKRPATQHLPSRHKEQSSPAAQLAPVEVDSSTARPTYIRQRNPIPNGAPYRRDSLDTNFEEMTPVEKERANKLRMREKSYRILGIAHSPVPSGAKKRAVAVARRFSRW